MFLYTRVSLFIARLLQLSACALQLRAAGRRRSSWLVPGRRVVKVNRGHAPELVQFFNLLFLFLDFHASVLEPDLDLSLGEAERVRDLDASFAGEVAVELELLFQLKRLVTRVCLTSSSSL